jgi:hypothetical protein
MTATNQFAAHVGLDWADKSTMSVFSLKTVNAHSM